MAVLFSTCIWTRLFHYFPVRLVLHEHLVNPRKCQFISDEWIDVLEQHLRVHFLTAIVHNLQQLLSVHHSVFVPVRFLESCQKMFQLFLMNPDRVFKHRILQAILRNF